MLDFRPPLDTPLLIRSVKLVFPIFMKVALCDTQVAPMPGAIERFKKWRGQRALVCPNHANRHDPMTVFGFSRLVGEDFNFIAAREVFDWDHGRNGWLLQHLGCYSVVRGAPDRESFKTTKRLICEGKKKLVLFPEGEISRQNDTLMPLESGAAQLTFWALDELSKQFKDGEMPDCVVIPLALKYTFTTDIKPALSACLSELETQVGVTKKSDSLYQRLRNLAEKLLETLEHEYGLKANAETPFSERIGILRQFILDNVARQLNVEIPKNGKQLESVRVLRNTMDDFVYADEHEASEYQRKIHDEKSAVLRGLYKDLDRVVNFIAIYDGYVKENFSQERFSDVLDRLETEVLRVREPSFRGPRKVLVDVGEPVNMKQLYRDYKSDKRATIQKVTDQIFGEISRMLNQMEASRKPLLIN